MVRIRSKTLSILVAVLLLGSMLGVAAPAAAADGCDVCCWDAYTLYGGQDWPVGTVYVGNSADDICVKYVLDDAVIADGFRITEVHAAVADDLGDIPQTKKHNPIPGQFLVAENFEDGVTTAGPYCFDRDAGWDTDTVLYIAAHAVVGRPTVSHLEPRTLCVYSGADTMLLPSLSPAVLSWVHPSWNSMLTEPLDPAAQWVWDAYYVTDPDNGEVVDLYEEFVIEGTPTSAVMKIAADNAFEVNVNGTIVETVNLTGDWRSAPVLNTTVLPDPLATAWSVVHTYDVLGLLATGSNEMTVTAVNAAYPGGTTGNPGATRYQLCITSDVEVLDHEAVSESAWSEGTGFEGENWATYSTYQIKDWELVDEVHVYGYGTTAFNPFEYPSNITLEDGGCYRLEASGTYRFAEWGAYGIADAQFNYRNAAYAPGGVAGWYEQASTRLQVWMGGAVVDWQPTTFNPEHVYTHALMGAGSPVVFSISDDYYGDNNKYSDYITVKIYEYK